MLLQEELSQAPLCPDFDQGKPQGKVEAQLWIGTAIQKGKSYLSDNTHNSGPRNYLETTGYWGILLHYINSGVPLFPKVHHGVHKKAAVGPFPEVDQFS
jgi:hypothetical protein